MPVATASSTAIVPTMSPDRYLIECLSPNAAPTAVALIVDGPGLPITTTAARTIVSSGRQMET